MGDDNKYNFLFEFDEYNGSAHFIPTLVVNNPNVFFDKLCKCIDEYLKLYNFSELIQSYGINDLIKFVLITLFSNARYEDYENPVSFLEKYASFFNDSTLACYDNKVISKEIGLLDNSFIKVNNEKEFFGHETPYKFNISFIKDNKEYHLPTINYGISNGVCYIYSIQNKKDNFVNDYTKKIKRKLYKVNKGVIDDTDYGEVSDTILGTTSSFVVALVIFLKILKDNNIDILRLITFLPDRYLEKYFSDIDVDKTQNNLTQKNILLFYRLKYHFENMEINYPIYDGYSYINDDNIGSDLIIKIPDMCKSNNELLNEIIYSFEVSNFKSL